MTTPKLAHQHLAQVLDFPADYEGDLDDLWACLCQLPVPFHISILHWDAASQALEEYAEELLEVFCDLVEEEPEFTFDMQD